MGNLIDLTGKRFGKLVVVKRAENTGGKTMWLCRCDCGKSTTVHSYYLTTGHTKSCGCLKSKMVFKSHGKSKTKLYPVWSTMKRRCYCPSNLKYKNYGARGIRICNEWRYNFETFYNWAMSTGYKEGLSIDRIDVNGDYCPTNCKWSTPREQAANTTTNNMITFNGKTQCLQQWQRETGIRRETISRRLYMGWTVEEALTRPVKPHKRYGA